MITNVRIGNDIKLMWQILEGETPVNLTNATDIKVSIAQGGIPSCNKIEITTFEVTDAVNGMISVEVQKEVITKLGYLWAVLEYTVPDSGMIDGNRKVTTDNLPVKIVDLTDEASQDYEFTVSSDILAGFQGLSAFEVWLKDNPDKTKEDYFNWLQKPATDAVVLIENKIEELDTAIQDEADRVEAENTRSQNEETRQSNETDRVENETLRNSSETTRSENEASRINAETLRDANETDRQSEETARQTAEGLRVTAETDRNNAEGLRSTAETNRSTAEGLRVEAEEQRVLAEELRQTNTATAISNAENATENANTAAQNADDARLAIQDDLALKADQADLVQLESEVEQLAYVKIKNEAVNGNFENGLIAPFRRFDGSVGESTFAINSSTPISGNYDVRLTITTPSTGVGRPFLRGLDGAANIGDKIYLHFYAKILSGTPAIRSIQDGVTNRPIYGGDVINGRNTRIIDVAGISANSGVIYFNSVSVWDMQMDNFMRINLTETFGAGNEPTEEEMNLLLDIAGISYIDDEVIIPAQKVMQWQLKLIRKNKNAIIALGGTII